MSISTLQHNIPAMRGQNNLRLFNRTMATSLERLASGSRLNQAKDDPSYLMEHKNYTMETRANNMAKQNAKDGAALLQIAEGTCGEITNILQRVKELAVQAANDTLSSTEREYIDIEASTLLNEVERIALSAKFGSKQLFVKEPGYNDSFSAPGNELDPTDPEYIAPRPGILQIGTGNLEHKDYARVQLPELNIHSLFGQDTLPLTSQHLAAVAIDSVEDAISQLNSTRTYIGALVNRLDGRTEFLDETNVNINDADSRIADTDFAKEVTALTSAQMQQQAAISLLAQSNAKVSRVLDILGG